MKDAVIKEDEELLSKAYEFYKDRIVGWMIADLKKAVDARANFLTALGCLSYTETVGIFLPPLPKGERGKKEERNFYRCLFRFSSSVYLKQLDQALREDSATNGLYALRNSMSHRYFPTLRRREKGVITFTNSIIAMHGILKDLERGVHVDSPPIFIDSQGRLAIVVKSYIKELEVAVNDFMDKTFEKREPEFVQYAIRGARYLFYGYYE